MPCMVLDLLRIRRNNCFSLLCHDYGEAKEHEQGWKGPLVDDNFYGTMVGVFRS